MSRICLYMDEDILQRSLILALRTSGVDVITTSDANKLSFSDEKQLIWAAEQGRAIYSFNTKDFCRLQVFLLPKISVMLELLWECNSGTRLAISCGGFST